MGEAAGLRLLKDLGGKICHGFASKQFLPCLNYNSLHLSSCSISLLNNLTHAPRSFSVAGKIEVRVPPGHHCKSEIPTGSRFHTDCSGRIGRFIFNSFFASGGYPWTVIRVEHRQAHMTALENASVRQETGDFARFAVAAMTASAEPKGPMKWLSRFGQ